MTENKFKAKHNRNLNETSVFLNGWHIRVYSDASFAANRDNSSQLGYFVLLADSNNECHVLTYCNKKCKRTVRSIMAAEVFDFSAAFDHTFIIRHDLQVISNQKMGIKKFTDSKQLFDVIQNGSHMTEKKLFIELIATRKEYNRNEISNVGLVPGTLNTADGLKKSTECKSVYNIFVRGKDNTPATQWIYPQSWNESCSTTAKLRSVNYERGTAPYVIRLFSLFPLFNALMWAPKLYISTPATNSG